MTNWTPFLLLQHQLFVWLPKKPRKRKGKSTLGATFFFNLETDERENLWFLDKQKESDEIKKGTRLNKEKNKCIILEWK